MSFHPAGSKPEGAFTYGERVIVLTTDRPGLAHRVGNKTITGIVCGDGSHVNATERTHTWVKVDDEFASAFQWNPSNMSNADLKRVDIITRIGQLDTGESCPTE